jgi:hypothetical protein
MLECVFTVDYELYGNGEGSLKELVLEPAKRLKSIFDKAGAKLVVFVETAELEKIDTFRTDPAIDDVKQQIREYYEGGFEIALHLHPQWCNARYENDKWNLDYKEYNLCTLSEQRITEIVKKGIAYLRELVGVPIFNPLSFRAGNWLFQPTATAAAVLAMHGIRIDSSVFKGGSQHSHGLDYRRARRNGFYWTFDTDVTIPDPTGRILEIPIFTKMVPFWKMYTAKRMALQQKAPSRSRSLNQRVHRVIDLFRFWQPLKFDFCRMTLDELIGMVERIIQEDRQSPELFKPMVAIGHTKDLTDLDTLEAFLFYLAKKQIKISTLQDVYSKCDPGACLSAPAFAG